MNRVLIAHPGGERLQALAWALHRIEVGFEVHGDLESLRRAFEAGCDAVLIVDLKTELGMKAAQSFAAETRIKRLFLCADGVEPPTHEGDAVLRGRFSESELEAVLRPILEAPVAIVHATLDPEQLLDCIRDDLSELDRLIPLFFQGVETQLVKLKAAQAEGDAEDALSAYHRIRGAAATAGAEALAELCKREMLRIEAGDLAIDVARLQDEIERFRGALDVFRRQRAAS